MLVADSQWVKDNYNTEPAETFSEGKLAIDAETPPNRTVRKCHWLLEQRPLLLLLRLRRQNVDELMVFGVLAPPAGADASFPGSDLSCQ